MALGLVLTRLASERGVHETAQRRGGAAGLVRHYVGYEEWIGAAFERREMARPGVALVLGFGDAMQVFEADAGTRVRTVSAFVVGHQLGPSLTRVAGHQLGVQVELSLAGARGLLGDMEELTDAVVPLDEALGPRGGELLEQLAAATTWEARLSRLDEALGAWSTGPTISPEVAWLHRRLAVAKGRERVERLMDETGRSRRWVTERFRQQVGVPPKSYARLLRFEHAGTLLNGSAAPPLAEVAVLAGYYDQSHLNREFAAMAGVTPRAYAEDSRLPEVRFVQDGAGLDGPEWEA